MAFKDEEKKKKIKSSKDFSSTIEFMSQFGDQVLLENYEEIDPESFFHTGNYLLNAHISGSIMRGVASNRTFVIAGDPKTGKSYLLYNIMASMQKMGYIIWFFETEGSADRERMRAHGVDLSKVICPARIIETYDHILNPCIQFTQSCLDDMKNGIEYPKIAIFTDSFTGLNSQKQYDDALAGASKQDMGTVAKDGFKFFRMLTARCNKLQIPIIGTAHVYEKDMGNFRKKTPTGGNGFLFMASCVILITKNDDRDEEKLKRGMFVNSEIVESRYSKPINVRFYLSFVGGMNPYYGLHEHLSWNAGVGKGKWVVLADLADEMLKKKIVTADTICTRVFTITEFKNNISKAKGEDLIEHLKWHINNGIVEALGDSKYQFTEKIKHNIKDGVYQPLKQVKNVQVSDLVNPLISDKFSISKDNIIATIINKESYLSKIKVENFDSSLAEYVKAGLAVDLGADFNFTEKILTRFNKKGEYNPVKMNIQIHCDIKVPVLNSNSGQWIIESTGETVLNKDLLSPKVFTKEVLTRLDEAVIKPMFEFKKNSDTLKNEQQETEDKILEENL